MTTYRHCESTITCLSITSFNRPGVAMMISAPARRLNCCSSTERCSNGVNLGPELDAVSTYPTDDRNASEAQRSGELPCFRFNLLGQFTCGCQYQRIWTKVPVVIRKGRQVRDEAEHWNDEGGSFTRTWNILSSGWGCENLTGRSLTSLCDPNDIAVLQTNRYGLPLNRRWLFVADLIDDFEDLWRDRRLLPGA